jgi:hypothetical protein
MIITYMHTNDLLYDILNSDNIDYIWNDLRLLVGPEPVGHMTDPKDPQRVKKIRDIMTAISEHGFHSSKIHSCMWCSLLGTDQTFNKRYLFEKHRHRLHNALVEYYSTWTRTCARVFVKLVLLILILYIMDIWCSYLIEFIGPGDPK